MDNNVLAYWLLSSRKQNVRNVNGRGQNFEFEFDTIPVFIKFFFGPSVWWPMGWPVRAPPLRQITCVLDTNIFKPHSLAHVRYYVLLSTAPHHPSALYLLRPEFSRVIYKKRTILNPLIYFPYPCLMILI